MPVTMFHYMLYLIAVFLCGLNGFAEFQQPSWQRHIISWQQPQTGCYEYVTYSNETDPLLWRRGGGIGAARKRRSVRKLPDNCSDHMSGLAMATLIQFLKCSYA